MVLHKVSQKGDIFATCLHLSESVVQSGNVASVRAKGGDDHIPYGEVE